MLESATLVYMNPNELKKLFGTSRPIIGMLHLMPLPGSPGFGGKMDVVRRRLMDDVKALTSGGGVHGLMIENFGDTPFYPDHVPAHTVAHMTALAGEVRRAGKLPLGINVLRNDGRGALAIAQAVGAQFIRVNVLCGARLTDQGVIQGIAHELLRERAMLGAEHICIFADVNVKHSAALGDVPLTQQVRDMIDRGGADAVIASGTGTGEATDMDELREIKQAAGGTAVLVGSGVTPGNIVEYLQHADGVIVGSVLKRGGRARNAVDAARVRELLKATKQAHGILRRS